MAAFLICSKRYRPLQSCAILAHVALALLSIMPNSMTSMPLSQKPVTNEKTSSNTTEFAINVSSIPNLEKLVSHLVLKSLAQQLPGNVSLASGRRSLRIGQRLHRLHKELIKLKTATVQNAATIRRLDGRVERYRRHMGSVGAYIRQWRRLVRALTAAFIATTNSSLDDTIRLKGTENRKLRRTEEGSNELFGFRPTPGNVQSEETTAWQPPKDCQSLWQATRGRYPGTYYVSIKPEKAETPFRVACEISQNAGWTIFQRRGDGSVDFYQDWTTYQNGFGKLETEFWLGNEHLYQLTSQGSYMLRIEMESWEGDQYWAEYASFRVGDAKSYYRLHVSGYSGNAGDSLTAAWNDHNGQPFSTKDSDRDGRSYSNCAEIYKGAWWFNRCFESHLNGVYYKQGEHNHFFQRDGIQWNAIHIHSSLKSTKMMLKPTVT